MAIIYYRAAPDPESLLRLSCFVSIRDLNMNNTNPSSVQIRPASESDVPLILQFIRDLAAFERHLDRVEATEQRIRESLFGDPPFASVVFAFDDDQPVGCAIYYFTYSTFVGLPGLYLEDLFVQPQARGRGIGRELLEHLAGVARSKNCWCLEWAVLDWNESAIGFYQSIGAVKMDQWSYYRLSGAALARLAGE